MLKKLELHGFKTFAGKSHFLFDDGVTAIVGPNGSGKSNITDAIRWLLGEQRASTLRAKKGEDLIFSGTERRARMGMAQGFLTLNNESGLLPIDFSEVVIGRRAYRSGESEYLINGSRVRLRDIHELLAHAGIGVGSYTVIGQGMVDAALSLRAEERRQLFEDAAGLGAYQGKRDESLRRLQQTEEHLVRVRDILAEIEPRVGKLRRQAERAEEYEGVVGNLHDLLRQFYGFRWGQSLAALAEARTSVRGEEAHVAEANERVAALDTESETLRQRQHELRAAQESARRERGQLRAEAERLRRERAVADERTRGFTRQRDALEAERAALAGEEAELTARLAATAEEGKALQAQRTEAQTALSEAQARLNEAESARGAIRRQVEEARRGLGRLSARQGELAQRQSALGERQRDLARERDSHERVRADLLAQAERLAADLATLSEESQTLHDQRSQHEAEQRTLTSAQATQQKGVRDAQAALHKVERTLAELGARRDVLARLRREGAGYEAGVRALVAERGRFNEALVGPVADHLRVPDELNEAISAALGPLLQAVVSRDDADPLRRWLHEREKGRVTLLPLADLRERPPAVIPDHEGIVGRAADLVQADDPTLLETLLGGWLVVRDWPTLHQMAPTVPEWHLVTLDGQVRRRSGAVLAGRGETRGGTLLAQSREWAALPEQIATQEAEQAAAKQALREAEQSARETETKLKQLERERTEAAKRVQQVDSALQRSRRESEQLTQEAEWRRGLAEKVEQERATLGEQAATLDMERTALTEERRTQEAALAEVEQRLEAAHPGALREAAERARTQVALADEQIASWERSRRALDEARQRATQRLAERAAQATALHEEEATLREGVARLEAEAAAAEAALAASLQQSRPLDQEHASNEEALAALEEQHGAARREHQAQLEHRHTAQLALQGAEERHSHLREQIEADLGSVGDESTALPVETLITSLPRVEALPDSLEGDVRRLRRRLGLIGAINPDAPTEYRELQDRFTFLSEQSDDLTRASRDLRQVVAELDEIMQARFMTTFEAIAKEFVGYFARLFGGGQAQLELVEPSDPMRSGIEIVARPPGKRAQSISLLSGGERALTAAALIFAILRVSPAPFCVLDEVDAMLDEANVGRFRDMLLELAQRTQFIVVTHNRGTIEAAAAIYGISQTDPGVSDILSLQLDEAIRAAKH